MRCAAVCLVRAKNEKGTTHTHMHLAVLVAPTPRLDPTAVARWLLLPPQRASCAFSGHGNQSIAKPPPAATPTGMVYLSSGAAIRENPEPDAGALLLVLLPVLLLVLLPVLLLLLLLRRTCSRLFPFGHILHDSSQILFNVYQVRTT